MAFTFQPDATLCFSFSARPSTFGYTLFNAAFEAEGLNWLYKPVQVTTAEQLKNAVAGLRGLSVRGCGVSMPWKTAAVPLLDELAPAARAIGAINTIVNEGGRLVGHNTDAWGAKRIFTDAGLKVGTRVLLLGAGGVAAAVAWALNELGASTTVTARRAEAATEFAARFSLQTCAWDERETTAAQWLVNATPIGMAPQTEERPVENTARFELVADLVASPALSRMIQQARAEGRQTIDGPRFTLEQAIRQFELYTGRVAPRAVMQRAAQSLVG